MILAVVFLALSIAAAVYVARLRRIHRAIVALVTAGVAAGAVVGSIPGAFAIVGLAVVAASGPPRGNSWPLVMTLTACGALAGITLGAGGAGLLARRHVSRVGVRAASAAAFALIGVGLSALVLWSTPNAPSEVLGVLAALVTATSVLGFVLPR